MAATLKLEIVTPDAIVYSKDVQMVTLPAIEGQIGIFPRHVPVLTRLVPGEIPAEAIAQMREHLDDVDLSVAARYERRFRHDVMAHIHAFADQAPAEILLPRTPAASPPAIPKATLKPSRSCTPILRNKSTRAAKIASLLQLRYSSRPWKTA